MTSQGPSRGPSGFPLLCLGQLYARARLVSSAADDHFVLPLVTAGEEKEHNSSSTAGPRTHPPHISGLASSQGQKANIFTLCQSQYWGAEIVGNLLEVTQLP